MGSFASPGLIEIAMSWCISYGEGDSPPLLGPDDKCPTSGGDGLTVHVSDQVCEAEKDEDGHALNLKGENYTLSSTPGAPLRALVAGAGDP